MRESRVTVARLQSRMRKSLASVRTTSTSTTSLAHAASGDVVFGRDLFSPGVLAGRVSRSVRLGIDTRGTRATPALVTWREGRFASSPNAILHARATILTGECAAETGVAAQVGVVSGLRIAHARGCSPVVADSSLAW
jgi:hypothetical protein